MFWLKKKKLKIARGFCLRVSRTLLNHTFTEIMSFNLLRSTIPITKRFVNSTSNTNSFKSISLIKSTINRNNNNNNNNNSKLYSTSSTSSEEGDSTKTRTKASVGVSQNFFPFDFSTPTFRDNS